MIKEDLFKCIDDNHKNLYIKCISDVAVELYQIISKTHNNVNSILESAKTEVKIINDAKGTTEKILGIFESSEEDFNLARINFIKSYRLWLNDCYAPEIVLLDNEAKTNSLNINPTCHDSITNQNESIIELEDENLSDVEIVNEVKYLNPRKIFDGNGNVEKYNKSNSIQLCNSQLIVGKAKDDLEVHNDPIQDSQSRHDESLSLLDNSLEIVAICREQCDLNERQLLFSTKSNPQENLDLDSGEKNNNMITGLFGSDLNKSVQGSIKNNQDYSSSDGEQSVADFSLLNVREKLNDYSDKKLYSKCFVPLECLEDQILNKFPKRQENSQISEDAAFHRLCDLNTLEKRKYKRIYRSSDSSSSSTFSSLKKKIFTKNRAKRLKCSLNDSDISSYYESSDNTDDESSCANAKLDQFNAVELDENEKEAMLQLLEDSDSSENSDEVTDNDEDQEENHRNKRKLKKKKSPSSTNCDKRNSSKSAWLNDPLLTFKLTADKSHERKDLNDFIDLASQSSNDDKEESSIDNERKIMKKKVVNTESESSESYFSEDCKVVESDANHVDKDHSNLDLETTINGATPISKTSGRRNIRKVLDDLEITEITRQAVKDEESRLQRLEKRKKQLNDLLGPEENIDNSLTLDFDFNTKNVLVAVDKGLVKLLKPHQKEGVRFMWDCCFESIEQINKQKGSGCILAHCMGLGKTLQIITLVHTLLVNQAIGIKTVMIVCPKNTILNWTDEFSMWLDQVEGDKNLNIIELTQVKQTKWRIRRLEEWQKNGGVLIIGYNEFRTFTQKEKIRKLLSNPGANLVVCDEGHLLKNEKSQLAYKMQEVKTQRRIILTGTPLQNNLNEYHCMVQFVKPHLLGCKAEFLNRFGNPIGNGQFDNSTPHDVKLMKHRSHVLHRLLEGCVQRRDYAVLTPFLPPKHEYVISVRLSDVQTQMYQHYISSVAKVSSKHCNIFQNYQEIKRLVAHPKTMQLKAQNQKRRKDNRASKTATHHLREPPLTLTDRADSNEAAADFWWRDLVKEEDLEDISLSYKLILLFGLLEQCAKQGDKVLVFSQCLYTLDLIELFLQKKLGEDNVTNSGDHESLLKFKSEYKPGRDYFRLDGKVGSKERSNMCKKFNDPANKRTKLFLISTKAGGLGINLIGANRVVVFDPSWNPSNDLQSIFRVFRFGQKKPCYIYRFLTAGTMEEKIYIRQVTKLSMSLRVLDEQQVERHYRDSDLMELYKLEPLEEREPVFDSRPRDNLLAKVFSKYSKYVYKFFEHDSLLENQEEEQLDEEEREQAWLEYHQEKLTPPYTEASAKSKTKIHQRNKLSETKAQVASEDENIIDILE